MRECLSLEVALEYLAKLQDTMKEMNFAAECAKYSATRDGVLIDFLRARVSALREALGEISAEADKSNSERCKKIVLLADTALENNINS